MPTFMPSSRVLSRCGALSFLDHSKIGPASDQDGRGHATKQPGAHDARDRAGLGLQAWGIGDRLDLAIENVVAVVRYGQLVSLDKGNRPTAELGKPSLTERQGERRDFNWQLAA